jgi:hypothetical protein
VTRKLRLKTQSVTGPVALDADAGLERIKRLEEQLALERDGSPGRRELAQAVRIEADLYRKSLDTRLAAATRTKKFERALTRSI